MFTNSQKEFLGNLIVEKMRKGHHTQVKIPKLMDYISKKANESCYVDCEYPRDYSEFKDLFVEVCIKNKKVPSKSFSLSESGFLDGKGRYPNDVYEIKAVKS